MRRKGKSLKQNSRNGHKINGIDHPLAWLWEGFFSMTGMSQVRGENPQEAPSAGELHSDLQVSDREVWERRSNSESVA